MPEERPVRRVTNHFGRFAAFRDLAGLTHRDLAADLAPAIMVSVLSVPQGVAYALIAGLPPAMGLYATAVPAIVGSLFRSSAHVITGPTNALCLLVGTVVASQSDGDPVLMATTLAVLTGAIQFAAGFFRTGSLVDYISSPVVLGYVTGAGVLIAVGQLHHATGTAGVRGNLFQQLLGWAEGLQTVNVLTLGLTAATVAILLALRFIDRRIPGPLVVMSAGIGLSASVGLSAHGVVTIADIAAVPQGLPPFTPPDWAQMPGLLSAALACTILSFVESSSVARSIASESGQTLDTSAEFAGQGLANIAAGLTGSFVTSGSLARSALNYTAGAKTRLSGVLSGFIMIGVLLVLGPIVDLTPIAVLAGLLVVLAADLVNLKRIRRTVSVTRSDAMAFAGTVAATWILPLDQAILVGVAISIVLFLRKARLLTVRELSPDENGRLHEFPLDVAPGSAGSPIRFIHLEGALFFGAAGELRAAIEGISGDPRVRVLVLRIKRTQGIDASTAEVLVAQGLKMKERGQHLLLVGMEQKVLELLKRAGIHDALDEAQLFPTSGGVFEAASGAVRRAVELLDDPTIDDPLVRWAMNTNRKKS